MQKAAAFFGGAVLGGVLASACGFDLFRDDRESVRKEALARSQDELQRTKALLAKSREQAARPAMPPPAQAREEASRIRVLEGELIVTRAALDRQRAELERAASESAAARGELASAADEALRWKSHAFEQIVRFFSRERLEGDAELVSRYLASASSKDEKQALLLEVIQRNKSLLFALPHESGARRDPDLGGSVGIVGTSAKEGSPEPIPAAPRLEGGSPTPASRP